MSISTLEFFVIVFPDPALLAPGTQFTPEEVPADLSFDTRLTSNLQTLSTNDADPDGLIQGLLYVPDIDRSDPCFNQTQAILPRNVTRQANLPNTDFNIIALAPWLSVNCTKAYLKSAGSDPIRAFIFYLPDNSTSQPPLISSPVWDLDDGGAWKGASPFPVYAIPGGIGRNVMNELNLYAGNMTTVPFGHDLVNKYQFDPRDYVRVYTEIDITAQSSLPALWVFLLIVAGGLIFILVSTSCLMHYLQRRKREGLRRRIARGQVDLEALGIKRLTVPKSIIDKMPLYVYTCKEDEVTAGSATSTTGGTAIARQDAENGNAKANSEDVANTIISSPNNQISPHSSIVPHEYLQHSQPTCPICLDDFETGSSTIRELPCGHIYHPECIDNFLSNNSSLCPMCKKSTLPLGYCPERITNAMVRRERAIRRLRSRVTVNEDGQAVEGGWAGRIDNVRSLAHRIFVGNNPPDLTGRLPVYDPNLELQQRRPRATVTTPRPADVVPATLVTATTAPLHVQTQSLSRQEVAQQRVQEILGDSVPSADSEVTEDQSRSRWRKFAGKIFPGFK